MGVLVVTQSPSLGPDVGYLGVPMVFADVGGVSSTLNIDVWSVSSLVSLSI